MDSPSGPGNVTALGWACTTRQSFSSASFFSGWPVQSPYRHSPTRSSVTICRPSRPCAIAAAVCWQRSSGLVTMASSGSGASRAASAAAWATPRSSSGIPGVQPVSSSPVDAVSPCRTSKTVVTPSDSNAPTARPSPDGRCSQPVSSRPASPGPGGLDRTKAAEPNCSTSPARTGTGSRTRQPFTRVPLCEPRSLSSQPSSPRSSWACSRDTDRSAIRRSQSCVRPMVNLVPRAGREDHRRRRPAGRPAAARSAAGAGRHPGARVPRPACGPGGPVPRRAPAGRSPGGGRRPAAGPATWPAAAAGRRTVRPAGRGRGRPGRCSCGT